LSNNDGDVKRSNKNNLFRDIFGMVEAFIQLYRVLSGKTLRVDEITRFDLDSAVLNRSEYNDVSFITKDNRLIVLIEHQSTLNWNMPIRMLIYYCALMKIWLAMNGRTLYGEREVALPKPEFYVVYNGKKELDGNRLRFESEHLSVAVDVLGIHYDKLADKSQDSYLAGYSFFVDAYERKLAETSDANAAFEHARHQCIEQGYLKGIVDKEDFIMYAELFSEEAERKALLEDARADGIEKGKAEGIGIGTEIILALKRKTPAAEIAARYQVPIETVAQLQTVLTSQPYTT
jgi:hypothetical protein